MEYPVGVTFLANLQNFGNENGRPEWTRTIDLFRVKEAL